MTLRDIARLIKHLEIQRSKTVEVLYPNPSLVMHVPFDCVNVCRQILSQMALPGQDVRAVLLESFDVRPGQHLYVKVRGTTYEHVTYHDGSDAREQRRRRQDSLRHRNKDVLIECSTAVL
jgi:hypothetical protein